MKRNAGFTLLELVVVLAIIGILSVLAVPNYLNARQKAIDVQRKSDLRAIQQANEMFKQDSGNYKNPFPTPGQSFTSSDGTKTYMKSFPVGCNSPTYNPRGTNTYDFAICLENPADPQGYTCTGAGPCTCGSGKCYKITEP